ncbi:hypothetical protein L7F22_035384 [Adiantum nelumboides]|nr:hypothetical protein [Adiantum nelumboides]
MNVPTQAVGEILSHRLSTEDFSAISTSLNNWSIWDSGEWWMLLAAQSMAVGTVMVRWLCQFTDPVMATGWHMVLGGIPLLALAGIQHDPALAGHIEDLELFDWLALVYTSIFGSAVSYGVFFYNASRGSLTKLSSLTFLTPMFAALFGYLFLQETLNETQLVGACITRIVEIQLVDSIIDSFVTGGQVFVQSDVKEVADDMCHQFNVRVDASLMDELQSYPSVCDVDGWLLDNPLGIRSEREIHALARGGQMSSPG